LAKKKAPYCPVNVIYLYIACMKHLVLFIATFACYLVHAQTHKIDSLRQAVYHANGTQARLAAILVLLEEQNSMHRDTLDVYAFEARRLAANVNDAHMKSLAELAVATDYYRFGWRDSALVVIEAELKKNDASNPSSREIYFRLMRLKALAYTGAHKYADALNTLFTLTTAAKKYSDNITLAKNTNSIGTVEMMRGNTAQALKWSQLALSQCGKGPGFDDAYANIYSTLGATYDGLGQWDSATYYNLKAIEKFKQREDLFYLALALQRQADIYISGKNIKQAKLMLDDLAETNKKTNETGAYLKDNLSFINFYILSGEYDKAIEICNKHLLIGKAGAASTQNNSSSNLRLPYYEALARIYKAKGDNNNYIAILEKLINAKDSFYTSNSAQALAEVQTKFEVQKKEATIAQQKLELVTKNYQLYTSLIVAFLGGIIAWLIFYQYRRRQRLRLKLMHAEERRLGEAAIAAAEENERKRIAANLHDSLGAYAASITASVARLKEDYSAGLLQNVDDNAQNIVKQLGDTIWVLNKNAVPLTGVGDRFKRYLQDILKNYRGVTASFSEDIITDPALPSAQALHLFRMMQECVNNALKHSGCTELQLYIESSDYWRIVITDNGSGFNTANVQQGNGLANLKQRAATNAWSIAWQPGSTNGTIVTISNKAHTQN
jgi:two-component system NarL family sensor kinase